MSLIPGLVAGFLSVAFVVEGSETKPTFNKDVLPVLQARCQRCHRPGEAAPFSMLTYTDARPWAKAMKAAVVARKMPPWFADSAVGHFKNSASLTEREIDLISNWADSGALEGNPADAPVPLQFTDGWNIGKPDAIFQMPTPVDVPAKGTVDYQWVVVPTNLQEDKWLQAVELRPGDRSVVHHIIAFYRRPGSTWLSNAQPGVPVPKASNTSEAGMSDGSIGAYIPGIPPLSLPAGRATLLPAGSDLVLQIHYTASGQATKDQSKVGVIFAKEPPKERVFGIGLVNFSFVIPPGAAHYRVEADVTLGSDLRVTDFTPHMHLRGKSFEFTAFYPDGREEKLLTVPRYDFNWQLTYQLAEEKVLPAGTRVHGVAYFDNSPNNPFNPDPKAEVRFGDQTWDEMMVGGFSVAIPPDFDLRKLVKEPEPKKATTGAN